MAVIRIELTNPDGEIEVPDAPLSVPDYTEPEDDAAEILEGFPAGWRLRLWKDVDLVHSLDALGVPDVDVVVP